MATAASTEKTAGTTKPARQRSTAAPRRSKTAKSGSSRRNERSLHMPNVPTWVTVAASLVSAGLVAGYVAYQNFRENADDGSEDYRYGDEDIGTATHSGNEEDSDSIRQPWASNGEFANPPRITGSFTPNET